MKMNVLHFICPTGLHGAERWILALVKYLDRDSVRSVLAVSDESPDQDLSLCDKFEELGLVSHKLPLKGKYDPSILPGLIGCIKNENIHVLHTHGYKSDILGLLAAKLAKIPVISTPHGFEDWSDFKMRLFVKAGLLSLKRFDRVVPLSEDLQESLLSRGLSTNKVTLIRNGVDTEEVLACTNNSVANNRRERVIGYVGRLDAHKNVTAILDTFDLFSRNFSQNVRLELVGDGPGRQKLEEYASHLRSSARIKFFGYRNDRLKIMKKFDLFCITSKREGIPRVIMEAMLLQIPVTGFDVPGVNVLVKQNKTGLLAEYGNIGKLALCWQRILENQEFAQHLLSNGKGLILKDFSAKRMAAEYEKLYFHYKAL